MQTPSCVGSPLGKGAAAIVVEGKLDGISIAAKIPSCTRNWSEYPYGDNCDELCNELDALYAIKCSHGVLALVPVQHFDEL